MGCPLLDWHSSISGGRAKKIALQLKRILFFFIKKKRYTIILNTRYYCSLDVNCNSIILIPFVFVYPHTHTHFPFVYHYLFNNEINPPSLVYIIFFVFHFPPYCVFYFRC